MTLAIGKKVPHTEHFNNEKGSERPVFKNTLRISSDIYFPKKNTEGHIVIFSKTALSHHPVSNNTAQSVLFHFFHITIPSSNFIPYLFSISSDNSNI